MQQAHHYAQVPTYRLDVHVLSISKKYKHKIFMHLPLHQHVHFVLGSLRQANPSSACCRMNNALRFVLYGAD